VMICLVAMISVIGISKLFKRPLAKQ